MWFQALQSMALSVTSWWFKCLPPGGSDTVTNHRSCSFRTCRSVNLQSLWMIWKEWPHGSYVSGLGHGATAWGWTLWSQGWKKIPSRAWKFPALWAVWLGGLPTKSLTFGIQVERIKISEQQYTFPGRLGGYQLQSSMIHVPSMAEIIVPSCSVFISVSELLGANIWGPTMW